MDHRLDASRDIVVVGGAKGVDTYAEWYARKKGFRVEVYLANWEKHGHRAGFIRNGHMESVSDSLLAFWNGSPGTLNTIQLFLNSRKPLEVWVE